MTHVPRLSARKNLREGLAAYGQSISAWTGFSGQPDIEKGAGHYARIKSPVQS
jgi:hypothetical protein